MITSYYLSNALHGHEAVKTEQYDNLVRIYRDGLEYGIVSAEERDELISLWGCTPTEYRRDLFDC